MCGHMSSVSKATLYSVCIRVHVQRSVDDGLVSELERNDFIQNQATIATHEIVYLNAYSGPERRRGFSSLVHKSNHYDGGFSTEPNLYNIMPVNWIEFDVSRDHPEMVANLTSEGSTFVDHGNVLWGIVDIAGFWPPRADQRRQVNWRLVDCEMINNRALSQVRARVLSCTRAESLTPSG